MARVQIREQVTNRPIVVCGIMGIVIGQKILLQYKKYIYSRIRKLLIRLKNPKWNVYEVQKLDCEL